MQKPYTKSIDHYGLKDQKSIESDYSNIMSNNDIQMADSSEPEIEKVEVSEDKFFEDYEFENYQPSSYDNVEVVNFEINSPDIEGMWFNFRNSLFRDFV